MRLACDALWRRHSERMLRCAAAELREQNGKKLQPLDVVQEVFACLLRPETAGRFRRERALLPWLKRVVRNRARDMLRKERRHGERLKKLGARAARALVSRDDPGAREALESTLEGLAEAEQTLFRQRFLENKSPKEVAAELGRPVTWVYACLHRLRAKMRARRDR